MMVGIFFIFLMILVSIYFKAHKTAIFLAILNILLGYAMLTYHATSQLNIIL